MKPHRHSRWTWVPVNLLSALVCVSCKPSLSTSYPAPHVATTQPVSVPESEAGVRAVDASEPTQTALCLPIVAVACGCVYSCGEGKPTATGDYLVQNAFWKTPLKAQLHNWCVAGSCTQAFAVELTCDGICLPRPADNSCGFHRGRCTTGRADAVLDGAYQVRWQSHGPVAGALSLEAGTYRWVGRPAEPSRAARFPFLAAPTGRYTTEMRVDAVGAVPDELNNEIIATVTLQTHGPESPSQRVFVVRNNRALKTLSIHSSFNEFEDWRIETLPRN